MNQLRSLALATVVFFSSSAFADEMYGATPLQRTVERGINIEGQAGVLSSAFYGGPRLWWHSLSGLSNLTTDLSASLYFLSSGGPLWAQPEFAIGYAISSPAMGAITLEPNLGIGANVGGPSSVFLRLGTNVWLPIQQQLLLIEAELLPNLGGYPLGIELQGRYFINDKFYAGARLETHPSGAGSFTLFGAVIGMRLF